MIQTPGMVLLNQHGSMKHLGFSTCLQLPPSVFFLAGVAVGVGDGVDVGAAFVGLPPWFPETWLGVVDCPKSLILYVKAKAKRVVQRGIPVGVPLFGGMTWPACVNPCGRDEYCPRLKPGVTKNWLRMWSEGPANKPNLVVSALPLDTL